MRMSCGINRAAVFTAVVIATSAALQLMAGEDLATSSTYESFNLDTSGRQIVVASQADLAALADKPVAYLAGETVTVLAPDGESIAFVTSAVADGDATFSPTTGGLWQLVNSKGQVVPVGVTWAVFNDGWSLDLGTSSSFTMHTRGDGPNRRGFVSVFPEVAYSGDRWIGDNEAASTLTFTPPNGESSSQDFTGTGTVPFLFDKIGRWNVRLDMSNGTMYEAMLYVSDGLMVIAQ